MFIVFYNFHNFHNFPSFYIFHSFHILKCWSLRVLKPLFSLDLDEEPTFKIKFMINAEDRQQSLTSRWDAPFTKQEIKTLQRFLQGSKIQVHNLHQNLFSEVNVVQLCINEIIFQTCLALEMAREDDLLGWRRNSKFRKNLTLHFAHIRWVFSKLLLMMSQAGANTVTHHSKKLEVQKSPFPSLYAEVFDCKSSRRKLNNFIATHVI